MGDLRQLCNNFSCLVFDSSVGVLEMESVVQKRSFPESSPTADPAYGFNKHLCHKTAYREHLRKPAFILLICKTLRIQNFEKDLVSMS